MQKIIILLSFAMGVFSLARAGLPERVLPLSQSIHPIEYYQSQMVIWEQELNVDKTDAAAWMNYYTAARNINILNAYESNNLDKILEDIQVNVSGTFEAYYIQYWQSNFFERDYQALLKAHELAPQRWETYHDLITYYKVKGNNNEIKRYSERLFNSGSLSTGILDWNYNALMSVGENGILLTHGDNDTYPAWVIQELRNIREDIEVINLYLLLAEDVYRQRVFSQLKIPNFHSKSPELNLKDQLKVLVEHMIKYSKRPLYLGIATLTDLRNELSDNLYLTGLAFQHSSQRIDNISRLDYNYQEEFRTESLKMPLVYDASQSVVDHMNMNYIPSFALLYRYYKNNNRENEAEETKELITEIATRANRLEDVTPIFEDKTLARNGTETPLDLRDLDRSLIQLSNQLYVSEIEVSNVDYKAFLHDLLEHNKYNLLEICRIYPVDWVSLLPKEYQNLSDAVYFRQGHPEQDQGPVVNISFEAAQLYCQWLTELYNAADYRKKRFEKVFFRLPTKEEWIEAAKGGRNNVIYPWGEGDYNRNEKGCLLANFNPSLERVEGNILIVTDIPADDDGGFFTVKVDAYFPNDSGLYNVCGNAAEMINKEGMTMGGGWNDPTYYMQIGVENTVVLPSPNVGFRIFMDVIKE